MPPQPEGTKMNNFYHVNADGFVSFHQNLAQVRERVEQLDAKYGKETIKIVVISRVVNNIVVSSHQARPFVAGVTVLKSSLQFAGLGER